MTLYLASRSPRRRELLRQIGTAFTLVSAAIDEQPLPTEEPVEYVERMARGKARAGLAVVEEDSTAVALGADTAVVIDEAILGKPRDRDHGLAMLRRLSGREHLVLSGVCIAGSGRECYALAETRVGLRAIDEAELEGYWRSGEPADKAGGYGIQGLGAVFVESLQGSYSGVVGLPLFETAQLLQAFAVPFGLNHE